MTRALYAMNEALVVQVAVMAAAPDDANDGVSILAWRTNGEFSGALAFVGLTGSVAATINAPVGGGDGVEIYGYRLGKWHLIAELRDGREITVSDIKGFAQQINVIGVFERLAIVGDVSAGVVTAKFAPIELWS